MYDVYACDVYACDVYACDVYACDVYACDVYACDVYAFDVQELTEDNSLDRKNTTEYLCDCLEELRISNPMKMKSMLLGLMFAAVLACGNNFSNCFDILI